MDILLLDNAEEIRESFLHRFVITTETFQSNRHYMWEKISTSFDDASIGDALAFLRKQQGDVLFMSESKHHPAPGRLFHQGSKHIGFVAKADPFQLSSLIEKEWFEDYILEQQNMYNPNPILPLDLYVFDSAINWCVVFTHETTDWEAELDEPMKAAASRYCIICSLEA